MHLRAFTNSPYIIANCKEAEFWYYSKDMKYKIAQPYFGEGISLISERVFDQPEINKSLKSHLDNFNTLVWDPKTSYEEKESYLKEMEQSFPKGSLQISKCYQTLKKAYFKQHSTAVQ
jgi:RNA binding exosome subunit